MQKYNVSSVTGWNSKNITQYLFVIPEQYKCNLPNIKAQTYFGFDWNTYRGDKGDMDDLQKGIGACNNGRENI